MWALYLTVLTSSFAYVSLLGGLVGAGIALSIGSFISLSIFVWYDRLLCQSTVILIGFVCCRSADFFRHVLGSTLRSQQLVVFGRSAFAFYL